MHKPKKITFRIICLVLRLSRPVSQKPTNYPLLCICSPPLSTRQLQTGKSGFDLFTAVLKKRKNTMQFLKNFFNDENTIVGLCAFERRKTSRTKFSESFFHDFQMREKFIPKIENNILLI